MIRTPAATVPATLGLALILLVAGPAPSPRAADGPPVPQALRDRAARDGRVRVIVELHPRSGRHVPEGRLAGLAAAAQRNEIRDAAARVIGTLRSGARNLIHRFETVPYLVLDIDAPTLAALNASPDIAQILEDPIVRPMLADSVPLVQGDQVWAAGFTGSGTTIAVLDSGVDSAHPFLTGTVVEEACYSSTVGTLSRSVCPNGLGVQIGPGAAAPCGLPECLHGTHVAGIVAGNGAGAGVPFSGVAPDARIMAVQVFSEITDSASCGGSAPCMGAFTSDIMAGLERVYAMAPVFNVVAVNMSLGGGTFAAPCDTQPYRPVIDNLRSIGVAAVVAAGNGSATSGITTPACISSAISVGSTDKSNRVSWFSNVASFLSLFAPGESITSSIPGGTFRSLSGTSMATPHISGAWALLKQAVPVASVGTILSALRQTGLPIADTRAGGTATVPRASVFEALTALAPVEHPQPVVTAMSPLRARAGTPSLILTLTGSGFDGFSVVRWNGADRLTTVVSATTIQASIPPSDIPAVGTSEVTVFTPAPGGGTSSALTFTIDPPATLTVSASSVAPAGAVTVTLDNGFGGAQDWIALAAAGTPNTSNVAWTYVGAGVSHRSWSVAMPTSAGTYEFRLFLDNGYARAATSPPVVVDPALTGPPVVVSLSPGHKVAGGAGFTLKVIGSGFVPSSVVRWNGENRATTFIGSTEIRAAIGAADIQTIGTALVSVRTPPPGGGTSGSLTLTIGTAPSLSVSATSAPAGTPVTVTLTGGAGGAADWLSLAPVGAPDIGGASQWTYVGAGVTSRTWAVALPAPGTYEFRLYLDGGYTRAATSPPMTATAPVPPTLSVDRTEAAGGSAVTVTLANGRGGATDWMALAAVGAPDTSSVQWTYVGAGQTTRTWTVTMPAAGGVYEFRLFLNGGYSRAATSAPVTVTAILPTLTVNTTSAAGGESVTATLGGGFGGATDWLALAAVGAPDTSNVQWTYVGAGVTTRTWTVTMPSVAGTYEFRLFLNGGYVRAATSPPVSVTAATPALTVSATSIVAGGSVTVTLTGGAGGSTDWMALAPAGAPNTSYLQWTYVGAGVTTRTWTVTMPAIPGAYEFRLFLNNGYSRSATSPIVTATSP